MTDDARANVPSLTIPERAALRRSPLRGAQASLAPVEPADGPALWDAVQSSRQHLSRWLPWVPYNISPDTSQRYAEACASDWDRGRALRFGIRLHDEDRLLGVVSLDNCVHMHRNCDLGYWLIHSATGRGLMTEAAELVLRFGFDVVGLHRVRCAAATGNSHSLGVIQRLAFVREGIARNAELLNGAFVDHVVFSRLESDPVPGGHDV